MHLLLLHGAAGGWDELLIALVAFGVLWGAVKLAGRKPASGAEDAEDAQNARDAGAEGEAERADEGEREPSASGSSERAELLSSRQRRPEH